MRLRDLHYMRRSDRRVITFLLVIFVIMSFVLLLFSNKETTVTKVGEGDTATEDGGLGLRHDEYKRMHGGKRYYAVPEMTVERFPFDPNTADSTQLLALGLQPWQVRSIYKYRAKGGVFRKREDFARVYGLTNKQYRELAPLIRIGTDYQPYRSGSHEYSTYGNVTDSVPVRRYATKLRQGERIELNGADTTALMRVPGIGTYFARQIVRHRKYLGGFYSLQQLLEIQDMPEEALAYFDIDPAKISKLNINKMSLGELKRHPYINYYQAKDIVDYRRLYGDIHDVGQLRLMKDFTTHDLERIKHYIEY